MTASLLTDGRLELGLDTGYVRSEFEQVGVAWGTPGDRVDRLADTIAELSGLAQQHPSGWPRKPTTPPVLVGGHGDRVLSLAARYADTVAFSGAVMSTNPPSLASPRS